MTRKIAVGVGVISLVALATSLANGASIGTALMEALPWVVLGLFWEKIGSLAPKRLYERWAGPAVGDELRSFSHDGLFTSSANGAHNYRWNAIREIGESAEFLLFYPADGQVIYLPKDAISVDGEVALKQLLLNAFSGRTRDLRLTASVD
jgi:hypothetical protein